ncbi:hypothetical protein HK407_01g00190 [Ordospora pajunii]|uniref:uncharacterized protein n=1 Tax=Ordospora pajunii TaxID=3039483 RepID=UPI0029528057|nr:uncharacterized protein HK407_01g00190 [Ordospora pajunii]KAH9412128.1 hypothetical protein HK407_01g00190 [Ordospora pajunii]
MKESKNSNDECHEFYEDEAIHKYVQMLNSVETIWKDRRRVMSMHFGELYIYNIDDLEDKSATVKRLINREVSYPNAFLASSLGFNKTTWSRDYERTLREIGVDKRPVHTTLRTMLLFEKLKWLVVSYHEMKNKRRG